MGQKGHILGVPEVLWVLAKHSRMPSSKFHQDPTPTPTDVSVAFIRVPVNLENNKYLITLLMMCLQVLLQNACLGCAWFTTSSHFHLTIHLLQALPWTLIWRGTQEVAVMVSGWSHLLTVLESQPLSSSSCRCSDTFMSPLICGFGTGWSGYLGQMDRM